jgi:histidinol-phosphate aminotransferase
MPINRRELFKISGGIVAGLAVPSASPGLPAQVSTASNKIITLSGNENPYGPSPAVLKVLNQSAPDANRYGYDLKLALVKDIAKKEGVNPEQIILSSGSTEAIFSTMLAYMANGEAVTADLTHGLIFRFAPAMGGTVATVPVTSGLEFDLDAIHTRTTSNTKLVYVCNPNNPTGTLIDGNKLRDFCTSLPKETIALIDEAYLEFTDDFPRTSMVDLVKAGHNVVVTRTFSKIHGLAGLRVGYAITRPDIAKRIALCSVCRFQGRLGVVAANVSLHDTEFHELSRRKIKEGREVVYKACEELDLNYARAAGNFVFIDPKMSHAEYNKRMLAQGIQAARQFPIKDDWARITIGTTEEMKVFARALPAVIRA